jgi:hypothetical protein
MRNYFSIQRLRTTFDFRKTGGGISQPLDFYEVDFSGEAQHALDVYMDYYNIDSSAIIPGDASYYDDSLYFELNRQIVVQLLNATSFGLLPWDHDFLQSTSPRFWWSHNK